MLFFTPNGKTERNTVWFPKKASQRFLHSCTTFEAQWQAWSDHNIGYWVANWKRCHLGDTGSNMRRDGRAFELDVYLIWKIIPGNKNAIVSYKTCLFGRSAWECKITAIFSTKIPVLYKMQLMIWTQISVYALWKRNYQQFSHRVLNCFKIT